MAQTNLSAYYKGLVERGEKRKFIDDVRARTDISHMGVVRWAMDDNRTTDPNHLKALSEASKIAVDKLFEPAS